jgi:diguanylate cyclase (GGDEF)-like protein
VMSEKTIRILLVEDNPGDARLMREMLNGPASCKYDLTHHESMEKAVAHLLANPVDIVLLDLGLPDANGLDAVRQAHAIAAGVPIVVLTGLDDELLAAQALQEGAQDCLIKGQIEPPALLRSLRYAIERQRIQAETDQIKKLQLQLKDDFLSHMSHSAQHDFLTGLPNRALVNDRITQAIARARRHNTRFAVLFLDLDHFKHINDSLGHVIGDKLLQSVGKRLLSCVRGSDTLSRQGGDEFVVLLSEVAQAKDAALCAQKMLTILQAPHFIGLHRLGVSASIGISIYPDDGLDPETLIKTADTAMYQAKEDGRDNYKFFEQEMNIRAVERQSIEESLRGALERQEFMLQYQPKIMLKTGAITGAEALLRWLHPERGLIPSLRFVPVAEDSGLILPIGRWVLREACQQARAWQDAGLPPLPVAVNISAVEFRDQNFLESVRAILKETCLEPHCLELELTESVLMQHAEATASVLQALKGMGVQLAVDDFGTGYSSLSYLRRFPIDALKIDQSFVRDITSNPDDATIVSAVINMGRSLKQRVIAEGVETREQFAFLQTQHCGEGQGYYFSRPVLAGQFAKLLETGISTTVPN